MRSPLLASRLDSESAILALRERRTVRLGQSGDPRGCARSLQEVTNAMQPRRDSDLEEARVPCFEARAPGGHVRAVLLEGGPEALLERGVRPARGNRCVRVSRPVSRPMPAVTISPATHPDSPDTS